VDQAQTASPPPPPPPAAPAASSDASGAAEAQVGPQGQLLLGAFTGVFLPTLLTIFGVIMFVRVGWSVGNAGLAGTWLIMLLAMGITLATGLSLSSIATNTRIGPGGPYAILARSLGFEVGGGIGVPLFLTRPLGVAMYVIGFREGWLWVFPDHIPLLVDLTVFAVLAGISYLSADLAFRVQYMILAIIIGSLLSIFGSSVTWDPVAEITWWGEYPGSPENDFTGTTFWGVFAVFFPATTGILAGANMSGDLKDPRRAIPSGTLWAIGVSSIVYFLLAWWAARAGTPTELVENYTLAIDKSLWPPLVLAGLLGATASSALAGLVGGPRILMAMGQHKIIPFSAKMAKVGEDGNPRFAVVVTSGLTLLCILGRDLNTIAPVVTMFFLITYAMLNVVVLVEQSLGLVSFRPTLKIPRLVPLFGVVGCIFSMFIVSPSFSLISVSLVVAFWIWIRWRGQHAAESEDVRSSVFVSVAQWAAGRVTEAERKNRRAWKPHFLAPVADPDQVRGEFQLVLDLTRPDGSVTMLGLSENDACAPDLRTRLVDLSEAFRKEGVQSSASVMRSKDGAKGVITGLEALQAAFFRPNLLLVRLDSEGQHDTIDLGHLTDQAAIVEVGMMVVCIHPRAGFGQRKTINLWVHPRNDKWDTDEAFASGNLNLALLTGYRLMRQWNKHLRLITAVENDEDHARAEKFQRELMDLVRLPETIERTIIRGSFEEALKNAPMADVNILGMEPSPDGEQLIGMVKDLHSSCLFVRDSGRESALV